MMMMMMRRRRRRRRRRRKRELLASNVLTTLYKNFTKEHKKEYMGTIIQLNLFS
jgi:hypothetical protein